MILEKISLDSIDFHDERFRISEDLDPQRLEDSLREIGQLNPVQLLEGIEPERVIVCGFRRLRALRRLDQPRVFARIWSSTECDSLNAFRLALWDNLSQRPFNAMENARVLYTLRNLCGISQDSLVTVYLPLLGLKPHKNVLRSYLNLHELHPELRRIFNEGHITLASVERLSAMPQASQAKMASVLGKARWSASLQREVLDLVEDLTAGGSSTPEEILSCPEVATVLDRAEFSPFQKGEGIHDILYRWKNPKLSAARERFLVEKKKLGLPGSIRISPDPYFETRRVRVEFEVTSAKDFRLAAAALEDASQAVALEQLFKVV